MSLEKSSPQSFSLKQLVWNILLITVGSVLCAVAINGILIPKQFVTGGMTGIALIIHKMVPSVSVAVIYVFLNIPLFIAAWMSVGRRFFFYSCVGLCILVSAIAMVKVTIPIEDKILSALLAGIISGAGAGITLRSMGSSGGMDIFSIMLLRRYSIGIGNTIMAINALVLVLVGFLYSIEAVLYTLIVLYVSSKVLNLVVTGLSQRKAVFIISPKWEEISREILKDIRRGVTVIKGEGGYSRTEERILYTVISFRDLGQLKRIVQRIDATAFVVVNDTLEVMNYRIGNQPHW
ncbi:MAG: YitT family protein [Desulfobulbaceae bacterium]|nr:YitT family protein [Desulfobulbaceae bacterium]